MKIDLNVDLGEGAKNDEALLALVSSANIACGFHAGDASIMLNSVRWAKANHVAIGAHPSFPDRENFGRTAMQLPADTIYAQTIYQISALAGIAKSQGAALAHVKPHGMLYNQAANDPVLAHALINAINDVDANLTVVELAGSQFIQLAQLKGLKVKQEAFIDRRYQDDGSLVPRSHPLAMIDNEQEALEQALIMVKDGKVKTISGNWIPLAVDTLCLHGDQPNAVIFAQTIRTLFLEQDIEISAY